jgi:hypothetical protein
LKKKSEKANPAIGRLDLVKRRTGTKETDLKRRWDLRNQQDIIDEVSNHLKREVTKVCRNYDPSCAIFSSFSFMVIFNIESADNAESQLMLNLK